MNLQEFVLLKEQEQKDQEHSEKEDALFASIEELFKSNPRPSDEDLKNVADKLDVKVSDIKDALFDIIASVFTGDEESSEESSEESDDEDFSSIFGDGDNESEEPTEDSDSFDFMKDFSEPNVDEDEAEEPAEETTEDGAEDKPKETDDESSDEEESEDVDGDAIEVGDEVTFVTDTKGHELKDKVLTVSEIDGDFLRCTRKDGDNETSFWFKNTEIKKEKEDEDKDEKDVVSDHKSPVKESREYSILESIIYGNLKSAIK